MTTYLTTKRLRDSRKFDAEKVTFPYCSKKCRHADRGNNAASLNYRDDDFYEFDEVCANCGSLIKASK